MMMIGLWLVNSPVEQYETIMDFEMELSEGALTPEKFPARVQQYEDNRHGLNLPAGYVPCSAFWLIRNEQCIGTVNIRHGLSKGLRIFGGHIGYKISASFRGQGYGTEMLRMAK
jgi:predicted acetyltransferase